MRIKHLLLSAASLSLITFTAQTSNAQLLYSQDFQTDDTANWTVNDGPTDEYADFFFDYSSATSASSGHVGLPPAPNSPAGETTSRGMFLQANLFDATFGGFSVSPTGQAFTGDYALTFDYWGNYTGPLDVGGSGTTNLSTYGIMTAGDNANYAGASDGLFFANTLDGGSSADFRVYSSERTVSYQVPPAEGSVEDLHVTYEAESRNHSATYHEENFIGTTAPAAQVALYPAQTLSTRDGVLGMAWHEVEIAKIGNTVTWTVDDVLLVTVDTENFTTPTGGDNILFGHSDTNSGVSSDFDAINLIFTLIDNIEVNVITASVDDADFDADSDIDGTDFLTWQKGFGTGTSLDEGDANGDGNVDADDLAIWETQYGNAPGLAGIASVPEPTTCLLALFSVTACLASGRQRMGIK